MEISRFEMRVYMTKKKSEIEIQTDLFLFHENKRDERNEEYPIATYRRMHTIKHKEKVSLQDLMAKELMAI